MSDTRCANSGYQLDVDEMTLEYLVYDALKTCIDEWDPEYQKQSEDEKARSLKTTKAPTLLSILETTIQLFKSNHPGHPFSASTAFYLKLLEFLLLFSHARGGTAEISESSYQSARVAGNQNVERRCRCWQTYAMSSATLDPTEEELLTANSLNKRSSTEKDHDSAHKTSSQRIPLVDLLPLFMDLSAQMVELMENDVSDTWLELAYETMMQAAIEICLTSPHGLQTTHAALLSCFGWGLQIELSDVTDFIEDRENATELMQTEKTIHRMLRSAADYRTSKADSWDYQRRRAISDLLAHIDTNWDSDIPEDEMRSALLHLRNHHSVNKFETQMMDYIKNLQIVWAQLNEEPVLLQIEQGRLEGLDDDEFHAFMERVGTDEQEAQLKLIIVPGMPKI